MLHRRVRKVAQLHIREMRLHGRRRGPRGLGVRPRVVRPLHHREALEAVDGVDVLGVLRRQGADVADAAVRLGVVPEALELVVTVAGPESAAGFLGRVVVVPGAGASLGGEMALEGRRPGSFWA